MEIVIIKTSTGSLTLTTDSPAGENGTLVLRDVLEGKVIAYYGPEDIVREWDKSVLPLPAALMVAEWAGMKERTERERTAAAWFCRQWPEGPQLDNYENWEGLDVILGMAAPSKKVDQ